MVFSEQYLFIGLLFTAWCFLHSFLISQITTDLMKKKLGTGFKFYRIFYNSFSLFTFLPILCFARQNPGALLFIWDGYLVYVRLLLLAITAYFFIAGAQQYDGWHFLGLRQIIKGKTHLTLSAKGQFHIDGVLKITRHPWYVGSILIIWLRNIDSSALVTNIILTGYLIIGTLLEERKLIREFGTLYTDYQKQVSMLFPFKWFKNLIIKI